MKMMVLCPLSPWAANYLFTWAFCSIQQHRRKATYLWETETWQLCVVDKNTYVPCLGCCDSCDFEQLLVCE